MIKVRECLIISEFYLPCVENCRTAGAIVTFAGTVAGAAKVALGIVQVIAGIALSIFSELKDNIYGYDEYTSLSKPVPPPLLGFLLLLAYQIAGSDQRHRFFP